MLEAGSFLLVQMQQVGPATELNPSVLVGGSSCSRATLSKPYTH